MDVAAPPPEEGLGVEVERRLERHPDRRALPQAAAQARGRVGLEDQGELDAAGGEAVADAGGAFGRRGLRRGDCGLRRRSPFRGPGREGRGGEAQGGQERDREA